VSYKIVFSPEAERTYVQNIDYLLEKWTVKDAQKFIDKTNNILSLLLINPEIGIAVKGKRIRKINTVPQVSIYYKIELDKKVIEIISFWNNYQNPKRISV
jgi:plasmid stabilization system protein ParE